MTNANPETFDLFAFSSGATEPEEIVTIYMDGKTAQQILDTEKRIAQASSDEVEELEGEREKLKDKFRASRLLVHVRSIPRRKRDQVTNEVDSEYGVFNPNDPNSKREDALITRFFSECIYKVVDAEGREDRSIPVWENERMAQWRLLIPEKYDIKLANTISKLVFKSEYFEAAELSVDF